MLEVVFIVMEFAKRSQWELHQAEKQIVSETKAQTELLATFCNETAWLVPDDGTIVRSDDRFDGLIRVAVEGKRLTDWVGDATERNRVSNIVAAAVRPSQPF